MLDFKKGDAVLQENVNSLTKLHEIFLVLCRKRCPVDTGTCKTAASVATDAFQWLPSQTGRRSLVMQCGGLMLRCLLFTLVKEIAVPAVNQKKVYLIVLSELKRGCSKEVQWVCTIPM